MLPTLTVQRQAKRYLRQYSPDVIVLIDYMGPNLGIGWFARQHYPQVPIVYYIDPPGMGVVPESTQYSADCPVHRSAPGSVSR
ncbi:hypothetical protein [Neosynechococcus sphagnicola]|uniref:hypothetical protein n=1 Tax=Neosynechococcus sphagnicola TaxID=1501145 RepID=UPI000A920B42|nr:hypothetical protein [Neosynechococcus sphagnicola]